jgi:hypothetical protein
MMELNEVEAVSLDDDNGESTQYGVDNSDNPLANDNGNELDGHVFMLLIGVNFGIFISFSKSLSLIRRFSKFSCLIIPCNEKRLLDAGTAAADDDVDGGSVIGGDVI